LVTLGKEREVDGTVPGIIGLRHTFARDADANSRDFVDILLEAQSDIGEGLLVIEGDRVCHANEAFCLISGRSEAELMALSSFFGALVVPEQGCSVEDLMRRHRSGEMIEDRHEITIVHKDGGCVDLDLVFRSLCSDSRPLQLIIVVRDITERRRMQEKLQSALGALLAVHEAGRILNSTLEQKEIGARLLGILLRVCELSAAVISIRGEDGRMNLLDARGPESLWKAANATTEVQIARSKAVERGEPQPFRPKEAGEGGPPLSGLCLPLVVGGRVTGMLEAYGSRNLAEKATVETLESLARQAASALENARLYQKATEQEHRLQDLAGKLLVVREEERCRLTHDIHDGLTQLAVAAYDNLQSYAELCSPGSPANRIKLDRAVQQVKETVEEARRIIADLRPTLLDNMGLAAALRSQVDSLRDEGWEITYEEDLWEERLSAEIETSLYAIAQEALTNVRKHAKTTHAHVALTQLGKRICLRIRDWGQGFDGTVPRREGNVRGEQVGLCSMRERVALLGGEFMIHSQSELGTSVVAEVPLPTATPARGKQTPSPHNTVSPVRLLIADDHALVLEGLRAMLAEEPDLEVVGTAADGLEAVELCRCLHPDLVLMDARMPRMDGLEATRAIKAEDPATVILMLTAYANPDYLLEAVRAGAAGYVVKNTTKDDLVADVRGALSDEHPVDQNLAMQILQDLAGEDGQKTGSPPESRKQSASLPDPLTPRELEVLRLVAQGWTNRQISEKLVVSAATVKVHVEHVLAKLEVSDRTQAAVRASEAGLLAPAE
jgi:PAS domain S-box-containing protein